MNDQNTITLDRDLISAAAQLARRSGLSTEDFVAQVLARELEVDPEERVILAYDAVGADNDGSAIDREEGETDEQHEARKAAVNFLFS